MLKKKVRWRFAVYARVGEIKKMVSFHLLNREKHKRTERRWKKVRVKCCVRESELLSSFFANNSDSGVGKIVSELALLLLRLLFILDYDL